MYKYIFSVFILATALNNITAQNNPVKTIKSYRTDLIPQLDGILDDEAWKNAPVFSDFRMVEPQPGSNPTEKTELRVIINQNAICLGIKCYDSNPGKISANTMEHDKSEEKNQDQLSILLDPFQDMRSAYLFIVNPKGARSEGFAGGERMNLGWDGLWDAKCRIDGDGWTAEIKIPFLTLSFNPKLEAWGFNLERYIARKQETIRYSGIALNSFFSNPKEAGLIKGIDSIKQGLGITFRPYAKASRNDYKTDELSADNKLTGGFDIYKNITPNLVGAVTVNTDFAETEVDDRKLNLTRFPLYFPEKRTFFLEGSNIFEFGSTTSRSFLPFFSRRIGLLDGNQIPLKFGTKLYGKVGNTNISMLDVQSGESEFSDPTNMFAGRISQNIFAESRVGVILTNGSQTGEKNTMAGADFKYKTSRFMGSDNFSLDVWGVKNWNEKSGGNKNGFGMKVDYPNDLVNIGISYTFFGDSIDPGLGFLPRSSYHSITGGISYMPRPEKGFIGDFIRQWYFKTRFGSFWNLFGNLESLSIGISPVSFRTESGEQIGFTVTPNREVLPEIFEVSDGIVIPAGDYTFTNYNFEITTATYRMAMFEFMYQFGQFYDGHLTDLTANISFRLDGYATVQLGTNNVRGYLPEGDFSENVYFTRLNLYLNPDLGISNYIQFDDISDKLGYNGRFFWQVSPGNTLYLVYNTNMNRITDPENRFKMNEDQVLFKIQMSIRF